MLSICFLADKMKVAPNVIWREWSDEDVTFMLAYYKFQADAQAASVRK